MKKVLMAATAALCFAGGSFAQENAGGSNASNSASGGLTDEKVLKVGAAAAVVGAFILNSRGNSTIDIDPIDPVDPVDPPLSCNGSDPLVDGVCIGSSTTVTVTGTGTMTSTVTVPVTFTYLPSA